MTAFDRKKSLELPTGKRIYFASDFHLGAPSEEESRHREKRIVRWLEEIKKDAAALFLVGDTFDFWFEYAHTIPKGFVRFLGKLAELADAGVHIHIFLGNHDLWMKDYFQDELGVTLHRRPIQIEIKGKKWLIGHGDGLGSGEGSFKLLKRVFQSPVSRWLFSVLPTNLGMSIAKYWSKWSYKKSMHRDDPFLGEEEKLYQFCKSIEKGEHHDYYIFGHRHLPLEMKISDNATYINLGEWFSQKHYVAFDGEKAHLRLYTG